jgi:hypothetical protein
VLAERKDQERIKMEGESLIGRSHVSVVMGRIWGPHLDATVRVKVQILIKKIDIGIQIENMSFDFGARCSYVP